MNTATNIHNLPMAKAYSNRYSAIQTMVQALPEAVVGMLANAERVDWGHVGDLGRIEELARELAQAIAAATVTHHAAR